MFTRIGSGCRLALLIVLVALPACSDDGASAAVPRATPAASAAAVMATLPPDSPTTAGPTALPTPWPTATETPPTQTTVAPSPTPPAVPTADLTAEDEAYLAGRMHSLFFTVQGLVGLSIQADSVARDASLLQDDDWRSQTDAYLAMLRTASEQLQEPGAVPPDFQGLEQDLATLSHEGATVAAAYADGVDRRDAQELAGSKADLDQALAQVKQIRAELKVASAKYGVTIVASH